MHSPVEASNDATTLKVTFDNLPERPQRLEDFPSVTHRHRIEAVYTQTTKVGPIFQKLLDAFCCGPYSIHRHGAADVQGKVLDLVTFALADPVRGWTSTPHEQAWNIMQSFDMQRLGGKVFKEIPALAKAAKNDKHPSHQEAKLLHDIMTRPISSGAPSLNEFLANRVQGDLRIVTKIEDGIELFFQVPKNPLPHEFNSILPRLAIITQSYNAVGRTMLLKGALHLIGAPGGPMKAAAQLTAVPLNRQDRLQKLIFSFPKNPAQGQEQLKDADFNVDFSKGEEDPIDKLKNVYE